MLICHSEQKFFKSRLLYILAHHIHISEHRENLLKVTPPIRVVDDIHDERPNNLIIILRLNLLNFNDLILCTKVNELIGLYAAILLGNVTLQF